MIIENWYLVSDDSVYTAPEVRKYQMKGDVYGKKDFRDGSHIRTSNLIVEECKSGKIKTTSGSVYSLGEPCPKYIEWCKENNYTVPTKENPIVIINKHEN